VDAARMRENLNLTGGLIVAEAVMMAAAPKLGRQHAHDLVYDACRKGIEQKRRLADVVLENADLVAALGGEEAARAKCDPAGYLGLSVAMTDRVTGR